MSADPVLRDRPALLRAEKSLSLVSGALPQEALLPLPHDVLLPFETADVMLTTLSALLSRLQLPASVS
jgi:hypothetical protein